MRLIRLIAPALAIVAGLFGAAPDARAQSFQKVVDLETIGGFTAYQTKFSAWYQNGTGRGFVRVERRYHSGTSVTLTGQTSNAEIVDLWWKAYYAAPWTRREVRADFLNVDLPNVRVTYMGRAAWSQLIRADLGAQSLPRVSAAMKTLEQKVWDIAQKIEDSDLFRYHAQGGLMAIDQTFVITQGGKMVLETSSARQGTTAHREDVLSPQDLNAFKALFDDWWTLPARYDWPPGMIVMDGIDYTAAFSEWGYTKTIASKTAADEDPEFEAVMAKVYDFIQRLNP